MMQIGEKMCETRLVRWVGYTGRRHAGGDDFKKDHQAGGRERKGKPKRD